MEESGPKARGMRPVSFRMLGNVYEDYRMIAQARGMDLSALLNMVLAQHHPRLMLEHAEGLDTLRRALERAA